MSEHPQGDYETRVGTTTFISLPVAIIVGIAAQNAAIAVVGFVATFSVVWFSFMRWGK